MVDRDSNHNHHLFGDRNWRCIAAVAYFVWLVFTTNKGSTRGPRHRALVLADAC
jgi:hypothetical protein